MFLFISVQMFIITASLAESIVITKQPSNITVPDGENATVSVTVTGEGLKYRWYYANKQDTAFSKSGATTDTYTIVMNDERSGRRIYCEITDQNGNVTKSETATLFMGTPLKISKQPADVKVSAGQNAVISVAVEGDELKYRWYYKDASETVFSKSSATTDTYSLLMNDARNGRQVYCVITDKHGSEVITNTVTLSMLQPISIVQQPFSTEEYAGTTVDINVVAQGDTLSYMWYYADAGETEFKRSGNATNTYSMQMNAARAARRIYCQISDPYGQTVNTETVTLAMLNDSYIPEGLEYSVIKDSVVISGYSGDAAHLPIPPRIEGYPVTSVNAWAFYGNKSLVSITLPNTITYIGKNAFYQCEKLARIHIPDSVTSIDQQAFSECTSLISISVPNSVKFIGAGAFSYCSKLTNAILPEKLTSIENFTFNECTSLAELTIPDGVMYIGEYAFSHCYQLKEVTFPNTVTAVGKWAFSHCNTLETVTIPESVFSIDQYAFYSCNALKSIIIPASITFIGNDVLSNCPDMSTIYVNDKSFAHQWCLDNGYENVIQIH